MLGYDELFKQIKQHGNYWKEQNKYNYTLRVFEEPDDSSFFFNATSVLYYKTLKDALLAKSCFEKGFKLYSDTGHPIKITIQENGLT